jgi:hypothetical protein
MITVDLKETFLNQRNQEELIAKRLFCPSGFD